jgi:hypothetical protein
MKKSRRLKWARQVACMEEWRGASYRVVVRKPKGKRPLVRPRHMWEANMKTGLNAIG